MPIREKTKYKNIYFNTSTKKYDVKYNYKEYNPLTGKNNYKSKWKYNLLTLTEAKKELAILQAGETKEDLKDITLEDIYLIWKSEAISDNYSSITIRNTEQQLKMIYQFLPASTKLKNINEETYNFLIASCRAKNYSDETLHNINACFRKLIRLAYRREIIKTNPLDRIKNKTFVIKEPIAEYSDKIITKDEFNLIDKYFSENSFIRLGIDRYKKYRLLYNFLYYSGARIGEALAITISDFEMVGYKGNIISYDLENSSSLVFQVKINKVLLSDKNKTIRYKTKNFKNRIIPLNNGFFKMYLDYINYLYSKGIKLNPEDRLFDFTQSNALQMLKKAIEKTNIRNHSLHDFRHSFISNLMYQGLTLAEIEQFSGDSQRTIFERYSHPIGKSKLKLIEAQENF